MLSDDGCLLFAFVHYPGTLEQRSRSRNCLSSMSTPGKMCQVLPNVLHDLYDLYDLCDLYDVYDV